MISKLVYAITEEYPTNINCSKSTTETPKTSCNMFKIGNKNTTTMSLTFKFQHTPLFSVFIVDL